MTYEEIDNMVKKCRKCGMLLKPRFYTFKQGESNILIIGESPAKDGWIESGKAFYNDKGTLQGTGRILSRLLELIGLTIEDISFTECCKCHLDNITTLSEFTANCRPFLISQLELSKQEIILTMGKFATQQILGIEIKRFKDYAGKEFKYGNKIVIPIYHCSPINPLGYSGNVEIFKSLTKYNLR